MPLSVYPHALSRFRCSALSTSGNIRYTSTPSSDQRAHRLRGAALNRCLCCLVWGKAVAHNNNKKNKLARGELVEWPCSD